MIDKGLISEWEMIMSPRAEDGPWAALTVAMRKSSVEMDIEFAERLCQNPIFSYIVINDSEIGYIAEAGQLTKANIDSLKEFQETLEKEAA
jgi:hypothetical protein